MCQAFINGPIQRQRRVFDFVSSFQSNKQTKKCLFQLKYATLLHCATSVHLYFFYGSQIVFPAQCKFSCKFVFKDFRDIYSNMMSLNNTSWYYPQFYTSFVNLSVYNCYWRGQSDPNNPNTGHQQALSKTSPGPEGHVPSRSDLKRTRERQELSCHSAREKLKIKVTRSKLRADPACSPPALDLSFRIMFSVMTEWSLTA